VKTSITKSHFSCNFLIINKFCVLLSHCLSQRFPVFEATYEGFKNDEGDWMLDPLPKFSTTATSNSGPGVYDIIVKGADAQNYEISYVAGKLTIEGPDFIPGDANGDGKVNVADIVEIVNKILGNPSGKLIEEAADVNDDGKINVTDIVLVVNIILGAS